MAHTENIFKATYSNVPVYEMPCKGVAVMKRRSDGWLNATQILKVAGFDKPQRTRVLEREVQKGTHEKVQGGYGKYQGTWIPPDRGLALSKQYMVDHLLQPIIDYIPPVGASPPPAPKHATAAPKGPRQKRTATPAGQPAPSRQRAPPRGPDHPLYVDSQLSKVETREDAEVSPVPTDGAGGSTASRTPSPLASEAQSDFDSLYTQSVAGNIAGGAGRKRKHDRLDLEDPSMMHQHQQQMALAAAMQSQGGPAVYARMILDYFVSESAQIPSFLISPPADFDPNVVIDDDGHTALHWACAMGRIRIVKLLLTAGADIFRANAMGQTALMRSVMFTNNYDLRKFPELFELLHRSTINIDRNDRTVFHYIVDIALQKGKAHAARYYLEVVLERLKEYPREVADILNFQDEEGETALTLAARARSKNLVRVLLNHGADPKIANRDGKSAEDYILEDERFRSSEQAMHPQHQQAIPPMPPSQFAHHAQLGMQQAQMMHPPTMRMPDGQEAVYLDQHHQQQQQQQPQGQGQPPHSAGLATSNNNGFYAPLPAGMPPLPQPGMGYPAEAVQLVPQQQLHLSETGQRVSSQVIPQVTEQLENLASTYDAELEDKEREIGQAHALLNSIQAETVENQRQAASLRVQADTLDDCRAQEQQLQNELKDKMGKRFRLGWEKYVRDEEDRQKQFVSIAKPLDNSNGQQSHTITYTNGGLQSIPADLQHIFAPINNSTSQNGTNGVTNGSASNGDNDSQLSAAITSQNDMLVRLKKTRKDLFDNYAKLQADSGTGEKFAKYRKLIALGCGIDAQDVDENLVRSLLDSLDNGDELPSLMPQPVQQQQQQQQQGYPIESR